MVETTLYITLVTFQMCFGIQRVLSQCFFTVSHTVGFHVGFRHYIYTIFVTQVIPQIGIRIVTGTNRIKVEFFHYFDILQHTFTRYYITAVRIHFMTVCPLEQYRLTVYQYLTAFQFDLAETDFYRDHFQVFAAVFQCSNQGIQVRCFSRPFQRIGNSHIGRNLTRSFQGRCSDRLTILIQ